MHRHTALTYIVAPLALAAAIAPMALNAAQDALGVTVGLVVVAIDGARWALLLALCGSVSVLGWLLMAMIWRVER